MADILPGTVLALDSEEAGHLLDLLSERLMGPLLADGAPLDRIRQALETAGVHARKCEVHSTADGRPAVYALDGQYSWAENVI